jgi:hypothetical protein
MASSFEAGMRLGVDAYDSSERMGLARRRMAIEEAAAQQARDEGDLRLTGLRRTDDETRRLIDLQTRGVQTGEVPAPGDGVGPPAPTYRQLDMTAPGDQMTMEAGLGRLSLAKGDVAGARQSMATVRDLRENQVFGEAVKNFNKDPTASHDYMRWVNTSSPYLTVAPQNDAKGKPTGYNVMTVGQGGEAVHKFYSPSQMAQLAGATALMDTNPTKALGIIAAVDTNLAATVASYNSLTNQTVTGNNTAVHNANTDVTQRITANAAATSAGATAALARTHGDLYATQKKVIDSEIAANGEARKIAEDYDNLDDKEKAGPKGSALVRKFNMLNIKPGGQLRPDSAGAGKIPATLNDQEKIAYTQAIQDISAIPVDKGTGIKDPAKVAKVYQSYGLDPARFGYESELDKRLKALGGGGGGNPTAQTVPGRPYYNAPTAQLQMMARRTRGTSTAESVAAQDELDARQGESRMNAY